MKINWKILIPSLLVVVTLFWMIDSIRARSYSGANLEFGVGNGAITVSNGSNDAVPVQLVGSGARTFSLASKTTGLSGSSSRQENNGAITQVFEFNAPPGDSTFTVVNGSNVRFIEGAATSLAVTAQPLSGGEVSTTLLLGVILVAGGLFYLSRTNKHQWMNRFRRQPTAAQTSTREAERQAFKERFDRATTGKQ